MRIARALGIVGATVVLVACGLEEEGLLQAGDGDAGADGPILLQDGGGGDGAVQEGGADAPDTDLGTDAPADVVEDAPADGGPDVLDAGCPVAACSDVPSGWNPVAYKEGTKSCPSGTTGSSYATNPTPLGGACTCGCTPTSAAVCDVGMTQTYYSTSSTCSTLGAPRTFSTSGQCLQINSSFGGNYFAATALAPTGGSCTAAPVAGSATATDVTLCTPSVCKEAICANIVPAGYSSCIEMSGDTTCPPNTPYAKLITIGDTPGVSCSGGCGCSVTGSCTSPNITYFSDTSCSSVAQSFKADGTCQPVTYGGSLRGIRYSATLTNGGCAPTGSSTATGTLDNRRTVCCRP